MFSPSGTGGHLLHSTFMERGSQRALPASALSQLSSAQNNTSQWHIWEVAHSVQIYSTQEAGTWGLYPSTPGWALITLYFPSATHTGQSWVHHLGSALKEIIVCGRSQAYLHGHSKDWRHKNGASMASAMFLHQEWEDEPLPAKSVKPQTWQLDDLIITLCLICVTWPFLSVIWGEGAW